MFQNEISHFTIVESLAVICVTYYFNHSNVLLTYQKFKSASSFAFFTNTCMSMLLHRAKLLGWYLESSSFCVFL